MVKNADYVFCIIVIVVTSVMVITSVTGYRHASRAADGRQHGDRETVMVSRRDFPADRHGVTCL